MVAQITAYFVGSADEVAAHVISTAGLVPDGIGVVGVGRRQMGFPKKARNSE